VREADRYRSFGAQKRWLRISLQIPASATPSLTPAKRLLQHDSDFPLSDLKPQELDPSPLTLAQDSPADSRFGYAFAHAAKRLLQHDSDFPLSDLKPQELRSFAADAGSGFACGLPLRLRLRSRPQNGSA